MPPVISTPLATASTPNSTLPTCSKPQTSQTSHSPTPQSSPTNGKNTIAFRRFFSVQFKHFTGIALYMESAISKDSSHDFMI